jgi:Protein of unknown function (DUF2637)
MIDLGQLMQVPSWITITVVAVLTACLIVGLPLARRGGVRAAALARPDQEADSVQRNKSKLAMFAALAPTVVVWLAVMGVSFIGLTGFAATAMRWHHWTNILVPLSLDGISVSFGGWAFVAVKNARHPGRSYKIVLAAATVSATLNFVHGQQVWSPWAGGYLAFLSLAGMAMFHEMLQQFMADYDDEIALKTRYPRFGQRWIYAPFSTFGARRAWIIYPPTEGTRPTVQNALEHWCTIKKLTREQRILRTTPTATPQRATPHTPRARSPRDAVSGPIAPTTAGGSLNGQVAIDHHTIAATADDTPTTAPAAKRDARVEAAATDVDGLEVSNADINRAAEDLWVEFKHSGVDLSGSQLLREFHQRHPHRRGPRWADYRRQAAQVRLAADSR